MEKSQIWTIVGISLIVAVIASFGTAYITGNVITVSKYGGTSSVYTKSEIDSQLTSLKNTINNVEAPTFRLTSDRAEETVYLRSSKYTAELMSASDTAATIKITNSAGSSQVLEIFQGQTKSVNGVNVTVVSTDESTLFLDTTIRLAR